MLILMGKVMNPIDMLKKSSHEPVENAKKRSGWPDLLQFVVAVEWPGHAIMV